MGSAVHVPSEHLVKSMPVLGVPCLYLGEHPVPGMDFICSVVYGFLHSVHQPHG